MSITIITSTQQPIPAANKGIYVVTGSNRTQPNYRYVADIEKVGGGRLARLKCDKLPTSSDGFFNVSEVAKTLIVPAKPNPVAGWIDAKVIEPFVIKFREEFGSTPAVSSGSTDANATIWKAYFPQQAIPATSGYLTTTGSVNALAITNRPRAYSLKTNQNDWLGIMKNTTTGTFTAVVIYPTRTFEVVSASGFLSGLFNVGAVASLTSGQTSDGVAGSVGYPTEGQSYQVTLSAFGSETQVYTITIDNCERYPSQVVYFRNALGGVDAYDFKMKNRTRIEAERSTYNRNSDVFGTTSFDEVWQAQYTESLDLNSDWLTDAEFVWLREMFLTSECWVLQNGSLVEATIVPTTYNVATRAVDRLQQLNIQIQIAYKNTTL